MAFLFNSTEKRLEESGHKCLARPTDAKCQMYNILSLDVTCNINTRDTCKNLKDVIPKENYREFICYNFNSYRFPISRE